MGRTILIFFLVNTVFALATWGFELYTDVSLPPGTTIFVHIVATLVAAYGMSRREVRILEVGEKAVFAIAATLLSVATLAGQIIGAVMLEGIEPSLQGISYALGIDALNAGMLAGILLIVTGLTFLFTYLCFSIANRLLVREG
jgi:hypothetical protein